MDGMVPRPRPLFCYQYAPFWFCGPVRDSWIYMIPGYCEHFKSTKGFSETVWWYNNKFYFPHQFSLACASPKALQSFSVAIRLLQAQTLCYAKSQALCGFEDSFKRLRWIAMLFHTPEALWKIIAHLASDLRAFMLFRFSSRSSCATSRHHNVKNKQLKKL